MWSPINLAVYPSGLWDHTLDWSPVNGTKMDSIPVSLGLYYNLDSASVNHSSGHSSWVYNFTNNSEAFLNDYPRCTVDYNRD